MPRLLALEWDAKEARVVVAQKRAAALMVEQAFAITLPQREGAAASEADIGAAVAKGLAEHGLGRAETLVAVGRSSIELKFLSTPAMPPEELPDAVRFQALRQFTTLGDDWPLDFVSLSQAADGGHNVLAAAISPELVQQIRQTVGAAGLSLSRLVLRPFAAASLVRAEMADGKCRMMVDLLADDADLTVLIGEQVIFPRTVRLPSAAPPEILAKTLLAEGRRTIIAAQNQLGGRAVEEVIIFGDGRHHSAIKQLLEQELSLVVRLVDPFDRVQWENPARSAKPEYPGTFAPLLGILMDEAAASPHAIDFLHPRKRPAPPNRRRTYLVAGSAAAAVLLIGGLILQMQLWALDTQIKDRKNQKLAQEKLVKAGVKPREHLTKLDQFSAADVIWLEELKRLSEKFPPAETVLVDSMTITANPKGGGKVALDAFADEPESITKVESNVSDDRHTVLGSGGKYDAQLEKLKWRFKEDVTVAATDPEAPLPVVIQPPPPPVEAPAPPPAEKGKSSSKSSSSRKGGRQ